MSYFAAALTRTSQGWVAEEVDLDEVEDLEVLAEQLRDMSGDGAGPSLLLLEEDDEYVAVVRVDGGTIAEARIGLTNMGSTPLRATAVEQALVGKAATDEAVRDACAAAADGTNPPADLNATEDYKRHLARVLCKRALQQAASAG